ncbi:MAG: hypothetical protein AB9903_20310 [Vulcanimicrobiota bacterium]
MKPHQLEFSLTEPEENLSGSIECLKMTFENNELRRNHLIALLSEKWHIYDLNKAGDLEKLSERTLLRKIIDYVDSKQKHPKVFHLEDVRAGLKKSWQEKDYTIKTDVAGRISENVLLNPKLLMCYYQTLTKQEVHNEP